MPQTRIPEAVQRVFTETFNASDIAEPLASFDRDADADAVRSFLRARDFDRTGVRSEGQVVGYVEANALASGACGEHLRPFATAAVLNDTTPLLKVLLTLHEQPCAFVIAFGTVGGIVTRADLQKPPVRMWLFGLVTLIEMRYAELIERHCPDESWRQHLSEGRLQKAQALLEERGRRNQRLRLIDCLQFADKGQIVARAKAIRRETVFASRSQAEAAVKSLEQLRNNLAHAQDILTGDWNTIVRLGEFLQASAG